MTRKQAHAAAARAKFVRPGAASPRPATNLNARTVERKVVTGPIKRTTAIKGTAAMRGGDGRRSLWAAPAEVPSSLRVLTHDAKWSATVSNHGA